MKDIYVMSYREAASSLQLLQLLLGKDISTAVNKRDFYVTEMFTRQYNPNTGVRVFH